REDGRLFDSLIAFDFDALNGLSVARAFGRLGKRRRGDEHPSSEEGQRRSQHSHHSITPRGRLNLILPKLLFGRHASKSDQSEFVGNHPNGFNFMMSFQVAKSIRPTTRAKPI